jgi:serine/threonine-protein kinase
VLLAGVDAQTRALSRVALGEGVQVHEVPDGEAALVSARASLPDLVVLDWGAPGLSAAQTVAGLRADPGTRAVKVILAVDWQAAGSPDVHAAGADETIEMPFSPLQLQVKLRRLLGGTLR